MKVLFTTPILEHPAAGGPQLRIENSIKALSRASELDIIYRTSEPAETVEATGNFFRQYASEYHTLFNAAPEDFLSRCISLIEKISNRLFNTRIVKHAKYILDHVDRREIDVLWFGYGNISYPLIKYIKAQRPNLKVVCDTDSVWSRFVLRELPYVKGTRKLAVWRAGRKKELEERAWVELCDVTTAVSEVDAEYYRNIAKDPSRVQVFSNVIDIDSYRRPPLPPAGFQRPSIYLAGSFGHYHSPMDTAARWMLEEVFPHVLKTHPNVHFYIVGRNSELGFGHLTGPNVTVTGRLETVLPYLCNTDVALVPLKFESGTRFKILEAGACKVPLVSTTLGAEGIPVVDGEHILIADEPENFAMAIVKLLDDKELAANLAVNCHDLVNKNFSVESLAVEAKQILEYLNRD
ncbi:glycosyltransferase family 4 protein [Herminiimonas arsenitoxidans]|uniref:glycosyltransferase family 4 protein n=1 Tax=Herminiimonas arsenitoxidans TaxID=1809410 RepID=UPI0009713871|nr:glycosyltransferase family 4 protein [Herminiimonas arsenitoxidans]